MYLPSIQMNDFNKKVLIQQLSCCSDSISVGESLHFLADFKPCNFYTDHTAFLVRPFVPSGPPETNLASPHFFWIMFSRTRVLFLCVNKQPSWPTNVLNCGLSGPALPFITDRQLLPLIYFVQIPGLRDVLTVSVKVQEQNPDRQTDWVVIG